MVRICPAVLSVTVTLTAAPVGVTLLGVTVQMASDGAPVQVSVIAWLNPASGVMESCRFAAFPAVTVAVGDAKLREKSCPVPDNAIVCGLPDALSVTVMTALREPDAAGVKVAPIEHSALAAREVPQLFVTAKSAAFAPEAAMLVMDSAALPVFVSVTAWAELVEPTSC